ncbi:MAG: AEC family transporter [Ruminococcaceae bacterium]|nr:AEC family transporter [Oscillospiraceae bacterium]
MEDLIFSINAVLPIVLMVCLGYLLRRLGVLPLSVTGVMNKLVFRVFLPAMLFLNVYNIQSFSQTSFDYIFYVLIFTVCIFFVGIPAVMLITKDNRQRGSILQGFFRSNYALVGIPLATSIFGTEGGIFAAMLSAFIIPLFNILAVVSLSIFGTKNGKKSTPLQILLDIVKNPLIQAIALGGVVLLVRAAFVKHSIEFRLSDVKPVYSVLTSLSAVATPLSLITLGAQFEFSAVPSLKKPILWTVLVRCLLIPVIALSVALALGRFNGAHFATFLAVYVTPVAVSSVPMAQEMGADSALSGQLVVWTTLISGFTIFAATWILKSIGVF